MGGHLGIIVGGFGGGEGGEQVRNAGVGFRMNGLYIFDLSSQIKDPFCFRTTVHEDLLGEDGLSDGK